MPSPEEGELDPSTEFIPPSTASGSDLMTDLAALDHVNADAIKPAEGFVPLPSGEYQCWIIGGGPKKGKNPPHNLFFQVELEVAGPSNVGKIVNKNMMLTTPDNHSYAKADFAKIGLPYTNPLSQCLVSNSQKMIGLGVNVTVRTERTGEKVNSNIYFNGMFQSTPRTAEQQNAAAGRAAF